MNYCIGQTISYILLKFSMGDFHKILLDGFDFLPYWLITNCGLYQAINELFYVSHKLYHMYNLNLVCETSTKNCLAVSIFSHIFNPSSHKAVNEYSMYSIDLSTDFLAMNYIRLLLIWNSLFPLSVSLINFKEHC
jgi:hypothetical protein